LLSVARCARTAAFGGGRAMGQRLLRESLTSERFRRHRQGLACRELFARKWCLESRKTSCTGNRFSPVTLSNTQTKPYFIIWATAGNVPTVTANGDERRWRRWIAIPHVVFHELMVPQTLAGIGVKRH